MKGNNEIWGNGLFKKKIRMYDVKYTDDIVKKKRNIVTIYKKIENVSYGIDFMKIWCKILYDGIFNKIVG